MPSLKISQQIIRSLQPINGRDTIYWDTDLTGFGIKATVDGKRSFIVQSRIQIGINKRRVRLNDCARMSVREAREEARRLLASMGLGHDPVTQRKAVELAKLTLRAALEDRIATRKLKARVATDYRNVVARLFSDWLDRPISTITSQMAIDRHREITAKSGPAQANYAMRILSAAFNQARGAHGLEAENPIARMREGRLFNRLRPRDGFVEPHELPAMLVTLRRMELARLAQDRAQQKAARAEGLTWQGMRSRIAQTTARQTGRDYKSPLHYSGAADIVRVLLLTGFRLEEAQALRWDSVDLVHKVITLTDNKASRTLRMPMCEALCRLMERRAAMLRLPDDSLPQWVFPTTGEGRYQSLSTRVMPGLSKAVSRATGKPFHIHAHKLRHTFATFLRALGHAEWTVAALLNHSRNSSVTTLYAAPMTRTMHGVVNEYEGYLVKALSEFKVHGSFVMPAEGITPAELLSGTVSC